MSVAEVASALGLDESTIRLYVAGGKLPAVRVGTKILIGRAAIDELVERGNAVPDKGDLRGPHAHTASAGKGSR